MQYARMLDLKKITAEANFFLFGPRSTGKTSLIKNQLPKAQIFDLLDDDVYEELMRRPKALAEMIKPNTKIVVIDEIQKLPKLLDEVHRLIEEKKYKFLLTGSSARKLRRSGANMLGGRAREINLFPLVYPEIHDFNLLKVLNYGGLPYIYQSKNPIEDLKAYVRVYLHEEIKAEAAVRNYERFVRFLETMALSNGQEINYQSLSSDSGVPTRTIEGHIEVLKDTLIGFELSPYEKTIKRKATTKSKFFFFDAGVSNFIAQKLPLKENHSDLGISFEQFIIQEVRAYLSYHNINEKMYYWRTRGYEVDLIVGNRVAIEIKFSKQVKDDFFSGLIALREEKLVEKFYLLGRFASEGLHKQIAYMSYTLFLDKLWAGKIL